MKQKKEDEFYIVKGFHDCICGGKMSSHRVDIFFVLSMGGVMCFEQFRN